MTDQSREILESVANWKERWLCTERHLRDGRRGDWTEELEQGSFCVTVPGEAHKQGNSKWKC